MAASLAFRRPRLRLLAVALVAAPLLTGCDDDPFGFDDWELSPSTALLYSLARPELNLESGFNLLRRQALRVEAAGSTGQWDFLVNTVDGSLVFMTPTALGVETRAGIAVVDGETFESIREAPADSARYTRSEPVDIEVGRLYVVRTNEQSGSFGRRCVYYGKVEPLEVDVAGGTLRFRYDVSPLCNSRSLVPPEN